MSNDGIRLFLQEIVDTIFDGLMRNSVSSTEYQYPLLYLAQSTSVPVKAQSN